MRKLSLAFILLFTLVCIQAQNNVEFIGSVINVNGGIIYSLPKTSIEIVVETKKTIKKVGPFALDAKEFFDLSPTEIITKDEETWEISSLHIKTKGIADENRTFKVTAKPSSAANLINTKENGIICSINATCQQENDKKNDKKEFSAVNFSFDKNYLSENYFNAEDEEKAKETAKQIYDLRDKQMQLLDGSTDNPVSDGASLNLMLNELKNKEKILLELFRGKTMYVVEQKTIEITPEKTIQNEVLFYFSSSKGISSNAEEDSRPIYFSLIAGKKDFPQIETSKKATKKGIYYCLPGSADIEIYDETESLYSKKIEVAQFGTTVSLPVHFLDKNKVQIIFNTETGAIKSINR